MFDAPHEKSQFYMVLVIHALLCLVALRHIWRPRGRAGEEGDDESATWKLIWSALTVIVPLLGPIMYFGMAAPPPEKPMEERSRIANFLPTDFNGLNDYAVIRPPGADEDVGADDGEEEDSTNDETSGPKS